MNLTKVYVVNRILSGFSAILSLSLLVICIWTLTSLFLQEASRDKDCSDHVRSSRRVLFPCDNGPEFSSSHGHDYPTSPSFEDENNLDDTVIIENDELKETLRSPSSDSYEILARFGEMSSTFRIIVIICLCGIIVASIIQLISSSILFFSPSYRISSKFRRIVGILFAVFILYLAGFIWPLVYDREHSGQEEDVMHSMTTLSSSIKEFFHNFHWNKWLRDLNLYYLELFCNVLYLFLYMVTTCCLLRCSDYNEYDV